MSSAENLSKQFGPRSVAKNIRAWSGIKLFDTQVVFLREIFKKVNFEKKQQTTKSMQNTKCRQRVLMLSYLSALSIIHLLWKINIVFAGTSDIHAQVSLPLERSKLSTYLYFYQDLEVMAIDSFNTFTVIVTPQSVLGMYSS